MLATQFLPMQDFHLYGDWLREQSPDTLATYFGIATSSTFINSLVDGILSNPEEHYFLVATKGNKWVGVIHMARISEKDMEFGIMVAEEARHQGVADQLMSEAITWIQNRGFDTLYLHCLNRNSAMKHLATKHGLELHEESGDVESVTHVPPASLLTYAQEAITANKNIFFLNLQTVWRPFTEFAG
jgi:RimJ/RimL family protein N-acetyltransferase